ncbi:hypothetical protein Ancab_019151 [Ancistrocladus abbreviatus]
MAKSLRSKREKRLRAIRREIVQPFYDNKEAAKLAAQEAALAAPKLPVPSATAAQSMEVATTTSAAGPSTSTSDIEMTDGNQNAGSLKTVGGVGKKLKKKLKIAKRKHHGKGKIRRRHI